MSLKNGGKILAVTDVTAYVLALNNLFNEYKTNLGMPQPNIEQPWIEIALCRGVTPPNLNSHWSQILCSTTSA